MAVSEGAAVQGSGTPRAVLARRVLGVLTLVLAVAAALTFPASADLADGWRTPIIAFELARQPADLAWLAGPEREDLRAAMDRGHVVDAVFPVAYGSFLAACLWGLGGTRRWLGVALAVVAIGMDLVENAVLVGLTEALRVGGELQGGLGALFVATWIKWSALGLGFALLAAARLRTQPVVAWICGLAALSVPVALVTASPLAGEGMAAAVGLAFLGLVVGSWRRGGDVPGRQAG